MVERNCIVNLIAENFIGVTDSSHITQTSFHLHLIDTKWTVARQAELELHLRQVVASEAEELLCWLR